MAHPTWLSISMIFSIEDDSSKGEGTRFSTARTVPCGVVIPTVVEPSCWFGLVFGQIAVWSISDGRRGFDFIYILNDV